MSLNDRIKEARKKKGITQEQLGELIGVAKSTIAGYEKNREPTAANVGEIADALGVDVNFLFQDEVKALHENYATPDEMEHIKKYRLISQNDTDGKSIIDSTIECFCNKIKLFQKKESLLANLQKQLSSQSAQIVDLIKTTRPRLTISYYQKLASAGSGEYLFDDVPTDTIDVPVSDISEQADFVIGVNGDSMEPAYYDGDKVYVKLAEELPVGHIGIFTRGNDCFIKELGADRLISLNHAGGYKDIMFTEGEINLVGEVLGKVEEL